MAVTQSLDVAALVGRIRRYRKEVCLSASGNVSFIKAADHARWVKYLDDLSKMVDYFQQGEALDVPEYHGGHVIELGESVAEREVENHGVNDFCQLLMLLENELIHCQSSRLANRLLEHDEKRIRAIIKKSYNFLEHLKSVLPIDLPETSPSKLGVGAGAKGINPGQ